MKRYHYDIQEEAKKIREKANLHFHVRVAKETLLLCFSNESGFTTKIFRHAEYESVR